MALDETTQASLDLMLTMSEAATVAEGISVFETVGMASRNLSTRTRVEYSNDLEDFRRFLERRGVKRLGGVFLAHLESYQAEMDARGYSPATRRRKSQSIKAFFTFLWRQDILRVDVGARLTLPKRSVREPRFLSEREYKELLRSCSHHPRDAALVEVFLQTGLRLAEVAGLTVTDLEIPAKPTPDADNVGFARVKRKGGKLATIPLNFKACKALKAYLAARPASEHEGLWLAKFGTPMSKRAIQAMLAKYLAEVGIQGASVHSLRHTMATHHVARGTDLKTVQETLGHADLSTTSMYVSLAKKAQRKALQDHAL